MFWDWICIPNIALAWPGFYRKSSLFGSVQIEMGFLGRSRSSLGAKSFDWCNVCFYCLFFFFFLPPPPTFICFPILVFGDLFLHHVGVCLIIALLFLCPNFILLPCHLIMRCMQDFAAMYCFYIFWQWWIYLHKWHAMVCSFDENTALVCACCCASDGHTSAHIFLDCCPTGLASLAANLFLFFFFFLF